MKIIYKQRNKLKNYGVVFPITSDNMNNMMYYRYLLDKKYTKADYTCLKNTTAEFENIFHLVVKVDGNNEFEMIKNFIKDTPHSKLLIVMNNFVTTHKGKQVFRCPDELPKKGFYFDMYNKQLCDTKIGQRNSILKHYRIFRNNVCFVTIGKHDSTARKKLVEKIKDFVSVQELITLKRLIVPFDKMSNQDVTDLDSIYKTLKRKKVDVQKELNNIVNEDTLPIDKYGVKLSTTKSYDTIKKRIEGYLKSIVDMTYSCPCNGLNELCNCRKMKLEICPCSRRLVEKKLCPCNNRR